MLNNNYLDSPHQGITTSTTMAGKGIKGNDGKAARLSLTTQIFSIFVMAVVAVAAIKTLGSGKWHSKAAAHEEHQLTNLKIREIVKDDSPPVADKSGSSGENDNCVLTIMLERASIPFQAFCTTSFSLRISPCFQSNSCTPSGRPEQQFHRNYILQLRRRRWVDWRSRCEINSRMGTSGCRKIQRTHGSLILGRMPGIPRHSQFCCPIGYQWRSCRSKNVEVAEFQR